MQFSHWQAIRIVAGREIRAALRTKPLVITLVLVLVALVGGAIWMSFRVGSDEAPAEKPEFTVTQGIDAEALDRAAGGSFEVTPAPDREAAQQWVADGDTMAALIDSGDERLELLVHGAPPPSVTAAVDSYVDQTALAQALAARGVDPADVESALHPAQLTVTDVSPEAAEMESAGPEQFVSAATAVGGTIVIFFIVLLCAGMIGGRVTEEKSSRIVEIILATIRPIDLLAGKLLGNLVVGLVAAALFIVVGVAAAQLIGITEIFSINYGIVPMLLVSFILAMLFYGSLYAAAGSMVARTEDLQTTSMPIMLLVFLSMYAPLFGAGSLDSPVMTALGWIPPMSITTVPVHYGTGTWGLAASIASLGLAALVTLGAVLLVARIYRNSILRNGKKLSWRAALKG